MAQKESKLSREIVKRLNTLPRTHAQKVHQGPHKQGMSDITVTSFGVSIWLETKLPTNRKGMTELQAEFQNQIRKAGGYAFEVRSVEDAVDKVKGAVLSHYKHKRRRRK